MWVYNYADDNSFSCRNKDHNVVRCTLENVTTSALKWFQINNMQANPGKFKVMILSPNRDSINEVFRIDGEVIECENVIKLLGINIDDKLDFNFHVSKLCSKASRQLTAISRVGKYLNTSCKLKLYHAFIMSNFNYCNTVWHLCTRRSTIK